MNAGLLALEKGKGWLYGRGDVFAAVLRCGGRRALYNRQSVSGKINFRIKNCQLALVLLYIRYTFCHYPSPDTNISVSGQLLPVLF